eukprot:scaffold21966_cov61-Phaeocystis_antarctica.AAC.3
MTERHAVHMYMSARAEAEALTLLVANTKAGYYGVYHKPSQPKPYEAKVWRGGNRKNLGSFDTAEEAALCIAQSPEGQAAAKRAAAPLTSEEARQQAQAEGLTLCEGDNSIGYFGVSLDNPRSPKPYKARVWRGGKGVTLGSFATAEEAALCIARSPEGKAAAAERAAAVVPLTSDEARQQARAEGLTLRVAGNNSGYLCVTLTFLGKAKPYKAQVWRGGKKLNLGHFATAEEAALCIARSPEGRAAADRAAAPPPLTSEEVKQQAQAEGLTLRVTDTKAGYYGVSICHNSSVNPYVAN